MAGIYIHIPFCKQACNYCNFHFSTQQKNIPSIVEAIISEAALRKEYISEKVETIYFGGGTPSLLTDLQIENILLTLHKYFEKDEQIEITLEANPDDITEEKLQQWKKIGINRLSIGVQSFAEADLQWMNRAHDNTMAIDTLQLATKYFDNISIDLIYGTPSLTDAQWIENIEQAIVLNIPHLSCYALTVEPKTTLQVMIEKEQVSDVDTDQQARHFELLLEVLESNGYEQYEISNFSKPNFRSKHNSSYWQGKSYIGLGPSAHSFNGISRQWNVSNNALYLQSISKGILPIEVELLTQTQQQNEYIMTSLRTKEGIDLLKLQHQFGEAKTNKLLQQASKFIIENLLVQTNNFLHLTNKGKFMADGIAADLFVEGS
jgi:oxygen-independent coproporphyrinogen-3 oxidase